MRASERFEREKSAMQNDGQFTYRVIWSAEDGVNRPGYRGGPLV